VTPPPSPAGASAPIDTGGVAAPATAGGGTLRRLVRPLAVAAAVVATAVGLLALLLTATGHDAGRALAAFWAGSLGGSYAVLSATLVRATPLVLAGLAVAIAFRAGILNIGAEGQLLAGGTVAAAIGVHAAGALGPLTAPAALLAGGAAGAAWAGIAALLRRRFGVLEVISTIMLNFVALYAVGWLVRGPLQEPTRIYPQSSNVGAVARLPVLVPGSRLHVGFALAVLAGVALWWVVRHTAVGFRLRATGANPFAAAVAGRIDVARVGALAFLASGALAGLAGAVEVTGVTYALYENLSPGYGYTAIAVALLARLDPLAVIAAGILFGALEAGAGAMQRDAAVPAVLVSVVEALLILLLLAVDFLRRRAAERGG
jgi:simple sugar transport system permease protein